MSERIIRADLHVHSDSHFTKGLRHGADPERIVREALGRKMNIIGLVEHNRIPDTNLFLANDELRRIRDLGDQKTLRIVPGSERMLTFRKKQFHVGFFPLSEDTEGMRFGSCDIDELERLRDKALIIFYHPITYIQQGGLDDVLVELLGHPVFHATEFPNPFHSGMSIEIMGRFIDIRNKVLDNGRNFPRIIGASDAHRAYRIGSLFSEYEIEGGDVDLLTLIAENDPVIKSIQYDQDGNLIISQPLEVSINKDNPAIIPCAA